MGNVSLFVDLTCFRYSESYVKCMILCFEAFESLEEKQGAMRLRTTTAEGQIRQQQLRRFTSSSGFDVLRPFLLLPWTSVQLLWSCSTCLEHL